MPDNSLDEFINEMLTAKKLPGMNDDVRLILLDEIREQLTKQINKAIISALPDDKLDEFGELLDQKDTAGIQEFIANSGVDIKRISIETMLLFRDLYLRTPEERVEK